MKHIKVKFEEALKDFTFSQFYEICKIFGVDVVDRSSVRTMTKEAMAAEEDLSKVGENLDLTKVKFRRDFDVMSEELCKVYHSYNRQNRRKIDTVVAKIAWGNKQAKYLSEKRIREQYNAGVEALNSGEVDLNPDLNTVSEIEDTKTKMKENLS